MGNGTAAVVLIYCNAVRCGLSIHCSYLQNRHKQAKRRTFCSFRECTMCMHFASAAVSINIGNTSQ